MAGKNGGLVRWLVRWLVVSAMVSATDARYGSLGTDPGRGQYVKLLDKSQVSSRCDFSQLEKGGESV